MRAEIDVPDITADEASTLQTRVAPPESFTAAGLEYHPEMSNLQLSLQRRPDGRSFIRITSSRAINDPFMDMILVATWSSGRIVRDYTMLLDPPALRAGTTPSPNLPQTSVPARVTSTPIAPQAAIAAAPVPPTLGATSTPRAAAAAPSPKPAAGNNSDLQGKISVRAGDSASKIASRLKPRDVSLDQMLVALLRANPDAFVNGNLNRLRAGVVLDVPNAEQASSTPAPEATQIVLAQSKDFNAFRRALATNAPKTSLDSPDRKASGKVDAQLTDKKPTSTTPDKLTLSKGAVQAKSDEAKIARERAEKDAATRAAELSKNLNELSQLNAAAKAPGAPTPAAAATTAAASAAASPASAAKAGAAPAIPVAAPPPAVAVSAAAPAASAASAAARPKPAPVPEPVEPPGILDELLGDPVIPAAAGGLLALLGGYALYRVRQRRKNVPQVESSFLASRLQPDSFFGASGGQQVETSADPSTGGASSSFRHSQMDGADDVDPVAEADVYLAYGRDQQAEDILKEALKATPDRLPIHMKLLGIYSKRQDAVNYQALAVQAFALAPEGSPERASICEQGLTIDPTNPLYQAGGANADALKATIPAVSLNAVDPNATLAMAAPAAADTAASGADLDLDLDLDFSADDAPAASAAPNVAMPDLNLDASAPAAEPVPAAENAPGDDLGGLDFDLSSPTEGTPAASTGALPELDVPASSNAADASMLDNQIDFDLPVDAPAAATEVPSAPMADMPSLDLPLTPDVPGPTPEPAPEAKADDGMLEFDLGSLSLDLDTPATPAAVPVGAVDAAAPDLDLGLDLPSMDQDDPLETKLALADEFISIGDTDGARALIEEVIAEAGGELRAKAERALANLR